MSQPSAELPINLMKGHYGWEADTLIGLEGGYVLRIFTMKRYGGDLVTTASRMKKTQGVFLGLSHIPTEDFNIVVCRQTVRVTSRVVEVQHRSALAQVEDIKARMTAFYAQRESDLVSVA